MPLDNEFWSNEERELWSVLVSLFVDTVMDGVQGGVDILPPDIAILMDFDYVNQSAIDYAREYRYELIKGITQTTQKQVQTLISDWVQSGNPLKDLEAQLDPIFGKVRAQMIASTEVTRVFQESNARVWRSTGFVDVIEYQTSRDDRVCPICAPLDGKELPLNDKTDHPPKHVRCRCWTMPVVSVDKVIEQSRRLLGV